MKILYVVNNLFAAGNGLSASARRTVQALREQGAEVRVLSGIGDSGERAEYTLPQGHVPVFNGLIKKHGYVFAHKQVAVMRDAVEWADLIHFEEPFGLQMVVCRMAERCGKPCAATYHLHPENLFSSVHLQRSRFFNHTCMRVWRDWVFNRCASVQCPTQKVRQRLDDFHFSADLRVISNGLIPRDGGLSSESMPCALPEDAFIVLCVGRYAVEKDQPTLLRAMRHSRYAQRIQLVLAGRGPTEGRLRRMSEALTREGTLRHPPIFGFFSYPELMALAQRADLYIHCATVEVEGLSCLEILKEGVVPVIADGPLTSTGQFALSPESLFPAGDEKALAQRIDHWLEDAHRRTREAEKYLTIQQQYDLHTSAEQLMQMYTDIMQRGA